MRDKWVKRKFLKGPGDTDVPHVHLDQSLDGADIIILAIPSPAIQDFVSKNIDFINHSRFFDPISDRLLLCPELSFLFATLGFCCYAVCAIASFASRDLPRTET